MSQQIDHLRASVASLTTVTQSAEALLADISQRLHDASDNDDMDAVDKLATDIDDNIGGLVAAVAANTPADAENTPTPQPSDGGGASDTTTDQTPDNGGGVAGGTGTAVNDGEATTSPSVDGSEAGSTSTDGAPV